MIAMNRPWRCELFLSIWSWHVCGVFQITVIIAFIRALRVRYSKIHVVVVDFRAFSTALVISTRSNVRDTWVRCTPWVTVLMRTLRTPPIYWVPSRVGLCQNGYELFDAVGNQIARSTQTVEDDPYGLPSLPFSFTWLRKILGQLS